MYAQVNTTESMNVLDQVDDEHQFDVLYKKDFRLVLMVFIGLSEEDKCRVLYNKVKSFRKKGVLVKGSIHNYNYNLYKLFHNLSNLMIYKGNLMY